jgi:hypothetical protein
MRISAFTIQYIFLDQRQQCVWVISDSNRTVVRSFGKERWEKALANSNNIDRSGMKGNMSSSFETPNEKNTNSCWAAGVTSHLLVAVYRLASKIKYEGFEADLYKKHWCTRTQSTVQYKHISWKECCKVLASFCSYFFSG